MEDQVALFADLNALAKIAIGNVQQVPADKFLCVSGLFLILVRLWI